MGTVHDVSLSPLLPALEIRRKEVSTLKIKSFSFIGGGISVIVIGFLFPDLLIALGIIGAIILITGFVMLSKYSEKSGHYRHDFKQQILADALRSIDPSLMIDDKIALSEEEFVESQLFSKQPDRYHSEDQIYGKAGSTKFSFSEVHAEYKTVTQTKNGRQEHWHTIFKGIVFCADFNKNFQGYTVVRPKDIGASIGAWISDAIPIFSSSGQTVKLENPVFDKDFITYSNDQIEARYILTPAMMERICELNSRCDQTISMSFIGTEVYIAFPLDKNYFEPPVFKTLLHPDLLKEDLEIIHFMYAIINELDLNTRIWGKS